MPMYEEVPVSATCSPASPIRSLVAEESVRELAASIQTLGLLQPIVVKRTVNGFEVVAGHRRLLAVRMLSWLTVPALVVKDDRELTSAAMLAENVQREQLTPVEEARAIDGMATTLGLSVREISERLRKSEAWVRGRRDLLSWPPAALAAVAEGRASMAALRPLLELEDEAERDRLILCAIESGANAQVTRSWVAGVLGGAAVAPEGMGEYRRNQVELASYVVHMPCFACRVEQPALGLSVVRICRECLSEFGDARDGEVGRSVPVAPAEESGRTEMARPAADGEETSS